MINHLITNISAFDIILLVGFLLAVGSYAFFKLSDWAGKTLSEEEKKKILSR